MKRYLSLLVVFSLFVGVNAQAAVQPRVLERPEAVLNISPTRGVAKNVGIDGKDIAGTKFQVDAARSKQDARNVKDLEFRWNCDAERYHWTAADPTSFGFSVWGTTTSGECEYDVVGDKIVVLEMRDEFGQTDSVIQRIVVTDGFSLGSKIWVDRFAGNENEVFVFRPRIEFSVGNKNDLQVRWDFDNDGIFDVDWAASAEISRAFAAGIYVVRMEVKDAFGTTSVTNDLVTRDGKTARSIKVMRNTSLRAKIKMTPENGSQFTEFVIDGTPSLSIKSQQMQKNFENIGFRWDFDGDGGWDTDWSLESRVVMRLPSGTGEVILEIRRGGETGKAVKEYFVRKVSHPVVSFAAKPDPSAKSTLDWIFDASKTTDVDNNFAELKFRWDFDGDGEWDTDWTGGVITNAYALPGLKTVRVEVMDPDGLKTIGEQKINIFINRPPEARFWVDKLIGTKNHEFVFDAGESRDVETAMTKLEFRWDFNGDGKFETEWVMNPMERFRFGAEGLQTAFVEVRDAHGKVTRASKNMMIIRNTFPELVLRVSPSVGDVTTTFALDASASSDVDSQKEKLETRWNWGTDAVWSRDEKTNSGVTADGKWEMSWGRSLKISKKFDAPGEYPFQMELRDEDGAVVSKAGVVNVHWSSPSYLHAKREGWTTARTMSDFRPDRTITRAEMLALAMRARKVFVSGTDTITEFRDVRESWAAPIFATAVKNGYVTGDKNGNLRPNDEVVLVEALKMIFEVFNTPVVPMGPQNFGDVPRDEWFADIASYADDNKIWEAKSGMFLPYRVITRAMAVTLLKRVTEKK